MKKIAIFDVDGVIIKAQTQNLFVKYLYEQSYVSLFYFLGISFWFLLYKIKIIKNTTKIRSRAYNVFRGWEVSNMEVLFEEFFYNNLLPLIPSEVQDLINKHKENNYEIILISASLEGIVRQIGVFLNVKYIIATKLEIRDGHYTGKINSEVPYGSEKVGLIRKLVNELSISLDESYAYSDHISDLQMLELVENSIVINPDNLLRVIAKNRGWKIYDF